MVTSLIASITNIFAATGGPNYPSTAANVTGTGTIAWTNPTRLTGNDTLYATAVLTTSTYSNYIQATGYGLSIPTGATINGIVVSIMRMSSANG